MTVPSSEADGKEALANLSGNSLQKEGLQIDTNRVTRHEVTLANTGIKAIYELNTPRKHTLTSQD